MSVSPNPADDRPDGRELTSGERAALRAALGLHREERESITETRPVAVLCGSVTRAVPALDAAEQWYRAQGYTVHKPVLDDTRTPQEHAERWYALIDACGPDDVVVACTMQHAELGAAVRREIGDALHLGKRVRLWVEAVPSAPAGTATCPVCRRPGRKLDPQGRVRYHHGNRVHAPHRCEGTGQYPDRSEERAS